MPPSTAPTKADQELARVRERLPGWDVWRVTAYSGQQTWCGRPKGAIVGIQQVESISATFFIERISQFEARIDMHIAATRTELASLPPNRPETPDARRVLDAQLKALLDLQARLVAS